MQCRIYVNCIIKGCSPFLLPSTQILVRQFSHVVDIRNELFIKKCADLISRKGYKNIHLGVEKTNKYGDVESFDIVYGVFIKRYCRCHFGDQEVTSEEIKEFEVGIRLELNV